MKFFDGFLSILFVILTVGVHCSNSCDGFSVVLLKAENCAVHGNIAFAIGNNSSAVMTKDCDMLVRMCGSTIGYNSMMVKLTVLRDGNKFYKGTFDFCEMLDYNNNPIANAFTSMRIDGESLICPVPPGQNCINQTFNTAKYVSLFKIMAGQFDIKVEGTHDTGKSCLHAVLSISYMKPQRTRTRVEPRPEMIQ